MLHFNKTELKFFFLSLEEIVSANDKTFSTETETYSWSQWLQKLSTAIQPGTYDAKKHLEQIKNED